MLRVDRRKLKNISLNVLIIQHKKIEVIKAF